MIPVQSFRPPSPQECIRGNVLYIIIEAKNVTDRYAIVETAVDFSKLENVLVIIK